MSHAKYCDTVSGELMAKNAHSSANTPPANSASASSTIRNLKMEAKNFSRPLKTDFTPLLCFTGPAFSETFCTTSSARFCMFTGLPCIFSCCSGVSASGMIRARIR